MTTATKTNPFSGSDAFSGGFSQPVFDAQSVFRTVLDALSRPGQPKSLSARTRPPKPMSGLLADILCALTDQDTAVFLDPTLAKAKGVANWLRFQTGAPCVTNPAEADFVAASAPDALPPLSQFSIGTADYPDRSATVLIAVASLEGGDAVTLSGPGIKDNVTFAPKGIAPGLWQQLIANHAHYPRGLDVIFVGPDAIAGLPRSTVITTGEG
ncbi:phosphonate C-P lyase system protein PhnH [Breoghania sp.]|uniref:phosphonate C-P lyase system protein PhnH n=1 Tax=Breoghania sp. TaxID=2065378 RepID=UPI002AA67554|nr:phosphonate C-P lyase system protein PhnH [Breoghania sp.]